MNKKICVLGLGYVGLPLAVKLAEKREIIGFDVDNQRVEELNNFFDKNKEVSSSELKKVSKSISYTSNKNDIHNSDFFIVTVPTPVNENKEPDLTILEDASKLIGSVLKKGDIVVYESTVYPGATEEFCVPILEEISGLTFNTDFYCGYSPERINPGDKVHTIDKVIKVTSGSTPESAEIIDSLYKEITNGKTHKTSSIKIAEAAKVIENTQRDINIALMNELSQIFSKLNIDTSEVLEAANTKWNFLKFTPGLVGGHCIGVDPYYLTHKAKQVGFNPKVILSGRETNDEMPSFIVSNIIRLLQDKNKKINDSRILILGATFKENCPDVRNSRVFNIVDYLKSYGNEVDVFDPEACWSIETKKYKKNIISNPKENSYDLIVLAVPHDYFIKKGIKMIKDFGKNDFIFFDLKSSFPNYHSDFKL